MQVSGAQRGLEQYYRNLEPVWSVGSRRPATLHHSPEPSALVPAVPYLVAQAPPDWKREAV